MTGTWTPDGHQKLDHTGLTVQASQFQLPDGTVLCCSGDDDMPTIINITIEKIEIKNSRFIGVKEVCEDDEDAETPEDEDIPE